VQDLPAAIRMAGSSLPVPAEAPAAVASAPAPNSTDLEEIERQTIERVFQQVGGDKALAGKMLGISRATLYRKLKRYHIDAGSGVVVNTASAAQNN
jgi:DNA-binding NtrC family response regulator